MIAYTEPEKKLIVVQKVRRVIKIVRLLEGHERVYFPHMCSKKTQAMNSRLITKTGTGPLQEEEQL